MSIDHRITEIEAQRNFLGTRCAVMADRIGDLEATIAALTAQLASAQKPSVIVEDDPGAD